MEKHICPLWIGYILASRLRKIFHNPEKILKPYVKEGMTVIDFGCAMGFFSLPLAKMVGETGKVICVDIQETMLKKLAERARKYKLDPRIDIRLCKKHKQDFKDLAGKSDIVLLFYAAHEIENLSGFFKEAFDWLKPAGKILIAEPKWHINIEDFQNTIDIAKQKGFIVKDSPRIVSSFTVLMEKGKQL